jgi:hypothetical protein
MDQETSFWAALARDTNGDGKFTIADFGSFLTEMLLLPGNGLIWLIVTYAPGVAEFLELDNQSFSSGIVIWLSVMLWLAALFIATTILNTVREIDRRLTQRIAGWYSELKRFSRIARRYVVTRLNQLRGLGRRADSDFAVDTVQLADAEARVLRCLAGIEDGAVMTAEELATRVGQPAREIRRAISRLKEIDFIENSVDRLTQKKGHCIAAAGQMFMLGA